jgi:hypothetical protein
MRLYRDHVSSVLVEPGNVEAGARAKVEHDLITPRRDLPHRLLDQARGIGGKVFDFVHIGRSLNIGRGMHAGKFVVIHPYSATS